MLPEVPVMDESYFEATPRKPSANLVYFELLSRQNEERSKKENRPIFEEQEYIKIIVGGTRDVVHRPVREADKEEYAAQYAAWKRTKENPIVGTPLAEWPLMARSTVEELAYFNIKTVEQLAQLPDSNAQKIPGIVALRQRANDFLAAAKEKAPLAKLRTELEKRDNQIQTLERIVKEQGDKIAALLQGKEVLPPPPLTVTVQEVVEAKSPKKRGRPFKNKEASV